MFKKINKSILVTIIAVSAFIISANVAHANPTYFGVTASTSAATTSPSYMTPGTATTSMVIDSFLPSEKLYQYKSGGAVVLINFFASSTLTVLNGKLEYSQDGIDWFADSVNDFMSHGTTTTGIDLGTSNYFSWKFASSSLNGVAPTANNNLATRAIIVSMPTRFARIVYSLTGGNGAVWSQGIPYKEVR